MPTRTLTYIGKVNRQLAFFSRLYLIRLASLFDDLIQQKSITHDDGVIFEGVVGLARVFRRDVIAKGIKPWFKESIS